MSETRPVNTKLLKILGVTFGIAVTIGGTIGGGILRKPGPIAAQLGDPWLILLVWALVGLYAFLGVLCTIELGTSVPQAGAWYVYARRAFGDYAGFLVGLTSWLGSLTAMAFNAYTMSEYIALLLPVVAGHEQLGAVLILAVLALLHWIGLALASQFQNVMSFFKAVGLLLFVLVCFVFGREVSVQEVAATTARVASNGSWIAAVIFSLQAVFYTYDGWHSAAYFAEEDKDPVRNLPRSMIGGISLIIVIYLLVNAAILYVLPMPVLQQSKLAAADAITAVFGPASGQWVTFFSDDFHPGHRQCAAAV
jgi:APA family basic amino acid/polyamine antiporter